MVNDNQRDEFIKAEKENRKEFKELTIEELKKGYYFSENTKAYHCIFCGEVFEEGLIYTVGEKMMIAEKAAATHIDDVHEGSTNKLIALDKQISGLSDTQKMLLQCINEGMENKEIAEVMNISAATVRAHKFNLQKSIREAKILLAIADNIENASKYTPGKKMDNNETTVANEDKSEKIFNLNSLHPFFTQVKYR